MRTDVALAPHTSLGLGGPSRWFAEPRSASELGDALRFARDRRLPVLVLGGGTNVVLPDEGWPGLTVKIAIEGVSFGPERGRHVDVAAAAGVEWDRLVAGAVGRGLAGLECLSGIPGRVGAAPVQNIGAYGQELSDRLVAVDVLDRRTLQESTIPASECGLRYRSSRFKAEDRDRYVIVRVHVRLSRDIDTEIRHRELAAELEGDASATAGTTRLERVRRAVLKIRGRKSMLADQLPSAGSFFLNPILSRAEFRGLNDRWRARSGESPIPHYEVESGVKVPAAWLVENAGYPKGTRRGRAGISPHHALALVSHGGSARELLELAREVREAVESEFGVRLEIEPDVVAFPSTSGEADQAEQRTQTGVSGKTSSRS